MLGTRAIQPLLARILAEFAPLELRLFGSRTLGDPRADSNWGIFAIVPVELPTADEVLAGYPLKRESQTRADVILCRVAGT